MLDNPTVRRLWRDRTVILSARDYECGTPFSAVAALRLSQAMRDAIARAHPLPPFTAAAR